jgi:hypothetical protein
MTRTPRSSILRSYPVASHLRRLLLGIILATSAVVVDPPSESLAADEKDKSGAPEWREAYAGVRVGYLEVEDVDDGDLNLGFMAGVHLHRHLALGVSTDYHSSDFSLEDRETYALTLGLEVHFVKPKVAVHPFLFGGLGYYYSHVERENDFGDIVIDDINSEGGFHYGAGLDIVVYRDPAENVRLAINFEARKIFTEKEDDDDIEPDGFQFTVGLKIKGPY